jgi:hypothetical protein
VENPPSDERRSAHTDDGLVSVAKKMLQPASRTMGCGKVIAKLTVRGIPDSTGRSFFRRFRLQRRLGTIKDVLFARDVPRRWLADAG